MKFFGSSDSTARDSAAAQRPKLTRRSSSLVQLIKTLDSEETLCILDLGSTSPANIRYCTERGHKIYSDDLLISSTDPSLVIKDEAGKPTLDSKRFLDENLVYPGAEFDIVLCWNLPDYLDESLVKPVVGRLWSLLKPGGMLLAFSTPRKRARTRLATATTSWAAMSSRCSTSLAATEKREPRPASSACNACSTTATSKISSAILPPSNFFSPATTSAKSWSYASPVIFSVLSS